MWKLASIRVTRCDVLRLCVWSGRKSFHISSACCQFIASRSTSQMLLLLLLEGSGGQVGDVPGGRSTVTMKFSRPRWPIGHSSWWLISCRCGRLIDGARSALSRRAGGLAGCLTQVHVQCLLIVRSICHWPHTTWRLTRLPRLWTAHPQTIRRQVSSPSTSRYSNRR